MSGRVPEGYATREAEVDHSGPQEGVRGAQEVGALEVERGADRERREDEVGPVADGSQGGADAREAVARYDHTPGFADGEIGSAEISECGRYRYSLTRRWDPGPLACWIGLNPSTADARVDDHTIRCIRRFTRREGRSGFVVVNLCPLRTTYPRDLPKRCDDPVAFAVNRDEIFRWVEGPEVDLVVAAWGASGPGTFRKFGRSIALIADHRSGRVFYCLGTTEGGEPRHPSRLAGNTRLVEWRP